MLLIVLAAFAAALTACGDDKAADDSPTATTEAEATPETATGDCEKVAEPEPKGEKKLAKPKLKLSAGKKYVATVLTNCGEFEITLDSKRAPKTGGSFVTLAKSGFFDGLKFHRIVAGFVIQGGDPKGDGTGGPGYSVVETPPADLTYTRGVVAMAKTGAEKAGTSGSQFFVVTAEDAQLPPDYALLGKVTKGQDVVDTIGTAQTSPTEQPVDPIVIRQITIEEK